MSSQQGISFFSKPPRPLIQAMVAGGAALIIMLFAKLLTLTGVTLDEEFAWRAGGSFMLLYALFNSVMALPSESINKYWQESIISYALLVLVCGGMAFLLTSKSISETSSFSWIYFMISFGYLIIFTICTLLKRIVSFAEQEDENMRYNK